jgi:hypothetical protein
LERAGRQAECQTGQYDHCDCFHDFFVRYAVAAVKLKENVSLVKVNDGLVGVD